MALYRVHFADHGDNIYFTEYHEHDSDDAVIETAMRRNAQSIGAGFEIWDDERLVHRHRNVHRAILDWLRAAQARYRRPDAGAKVARPLSDKLTLAVVEINIEQYTQHYVMLMVPLRA